MLIWILHNWFSNIAHLLCSTTTIVLQQASTRKVKPETNLDFLEQETVSGIGIRWAICKSAPHPRQITMPSPHHSQILCSMEINVGWCLQSYLWSSPRRHLSPVLFSVYIDAIKKIANLVIVFTRYSVCWQWVNVSSGTSSPGLSWTNSTEL